MFVSLASGSLHGVDALRVDVEVDISSRSLPKFIIVGRAEGAAREAASRIDVALSASGFKMPQKRITVNLAPANLRKVGAGYDLPVALGVLAAANIIPTQCLEGWFFAAELSLTGELRPMLGTLSLALLARQEGAKGIIVAPGNAQEGALVQGITVLAPHNLAQCVQQLTHPQEQVPALPPDLSHIQTQYAVDFHDVKGQMAAKRALEVAAAGGHNVLLVGPPGSGKTMLAQRLPTILPPLSFEESLEVTKIYSVAAENPSSSQLMRLRPFRAPHHSISDAALIGGGDFPKPGEVSLSHRGVLFLDELLEFKKSTLEVLRQPLEKGVVSISRVKQAVDFPASFMLVVAMNPCPCGYHGDPNHPCVCSSKQIAKYVSKLSGPLKDRIDVHMEVSAVPYEDLRTPRSEMDYGGSSEAMRARVLAARTIQHERYAHTSCMCNAMLDGALLEQHCALDAKGAATLERVIRGLKLTSARAYTRILRLSRTIADLDNAPHIRTEHIYEAVSLRVLDRSSK